jgi:hypothetical protein
VNGSTRQNITLNRADNDFTQVSATGGAVSLRDANALTLNVLDASGLASLQTGRLTLGSASGLMTADALTLSSLDFDMQGRTFTLTGTGGASLTVDGDANMGQLDAGAGPVTLTVSGKLVDALTTMVGTVEVANLVSSGAVAIAAQSVGSLAEDFDAKVSNISSLVANDATQGNVVMEIRNNSAISLGTLTASHGLVQLNVVGADLSLGATSVRDALALQLDGGTLNLTHNVSANGVRGLASQARPACAVGALSASHRLSAKPAHAVRRWKRVFFMVIDLFIQKKKGRKLYFTLVLNKGKTSPTIPLPTQYLK